MKESTIEAIGSIIIVLGFTALIAGIFYPVIFAIYGAYIIIRALYAKFIEKETLDTQSIVVLGLIGPLGLLAELLDKYRYY